MRTRSLALFALAVLSPVLRAQSFNIDFGANPAHAPLPSAAYGAAAGQFGAWNAATPAGGSVPPTPLVDLSGAATPAQVQSTAASAWAKGTPSSGIAALMGDWIELSDSDGSTPSITITVSNLDAGDYDVFTYARVLDWTCPVRVTVVGSSDPAATSGSSTLGNDVNEPASYVRHRVHVSGGVLTVVVSGETYCSFLRFAACNGLQLVRLDGGSTPICAGDGSGAACPCGNSGAASRGCASSFEPLGASLGASGVASVTADSLALDAHGVSNSVVSLFQGTQALQGGAGTAFGDGLRCAGGATRRLGHVLASANHAAFPALGDAPISVRGAVGGAGGTRQYQVWYRNAAEFCTSATFNFTNAVSVRWAP